MSYCAYDPVTKVFLGDIASIGGWRDFTAWAHGKGFALKMFIEEGATVKPEELTAELEKLRSDVPEVEDVRQQLLAAAKDAGHALALADGTEELE